MLALDAIDRVISTIRKSKDKDEARVNLMKLFKLTEVQTTAILEMRLQTLAALERKKDRGRIKGEKGPDQGIDAHLENTGADHRASSKKK